MVARDCIPFFVRASRQWCSSVVSPWVSLLNPFPSLRSVCGIHVIAGLICGWLIYAFGSCATLTTFMVVMTNFILRIGAGLFSKAIGDFQENAFNHLLGADVDDAGGPGPGSFNVHESVCHLDCYNPEDTMGKNSQTLF